MITLLEDVPPPVLASFLGLHPATAERWARYAEPDWAAYLDPRTASRPTALTMPEQPGRRR